MHDPGETRHRQAPALALSAGPRSPPGLLVPVTREFTFTGLRGESGRAPPHGVGNDPLGSAVSAPKAGI